MDGMLVHRRVTPKHFFLVPIYTPEYVERGTTRVNILAQEPRAGLESVPPDPESSALTINKLITIRHIMACFKHRAITIPNLIKELNST